MYSSVVLSHEERTIKVECEIYNRNCTTGPPCITEMQTCDTVHENCYVVWKTVNVEGVNVSEVQIKGCFTNNDECNQTRCVDKRMDTKNLNFCCCKENGCNSDFLWVPTPTEPPMLHSGKKHFSQMKITHF